MKVYVVTHGQWDSYTTEAMFTSRELARSYIDAAVKPRYRFEHVNKTITEWDVHETLIPEVYEDIKITESNEHLVSLPGSDDTDDDGRPKGNTR